MKIFYFVKKKKNVFHYYLQITYMQTICQKKFITRTFIYQFGIWFCIRLLVILIFIMLIASTNNLIFFCLIFQNFTKTKPSLMGGSSIFQKITSLVIIFIIIILGIFNLLKKRIWLFIIINKSILFKFRIYIVFIIIIFI